MFALLLFALQDSIIKGLSQQYPILQVLTFRSVIVLTLLVAIGLYLQGRRILKGRRPAPMLARGVLAFFAFTSYYFALQKIPLADAATVYMTAPLFVTLLSSLLLREKVGIHRWAAVGLGFAAVIVMLNPGSALFRIESALPLFSAMSYAMIPIINRRIAMSEHALTMAIYTTFTYLSLILLASAMIHLFPAADSGNGIVAAVFQRWFWLSTDDFLLTLLAGCIFSGALLCITQAYRIAIVSSVAPFEYSYLLWATIIGYLFFGDIPGIRTVFGGSVVVLCGCYIIYRESGRKSN
jgi:drug/metabolite transporter (DMT)-like permease